MKKVIALALTLILSVSAYAETIVQPVYVPTLIDVMNDIGILVLDDGYSINKQEMEKSLYSFYEFNPTDGINILENFKDGKPFNYVIRFNQSVPYAMKYKDKLMVLFIEITAGYETKKALSIVDYLLNTLKPDDLEVHEGVSFVTIEGITFNMLDAMGILQLSVQKD